jgi:hypothetical protein
MRNSRAALAMAVLASVAFTVPAVAAEDSKTRGAVRELANDGLKLYDAGNYAGALEKFTRANKLIPAPTLQVRIARSLEKLGRLVDASEMYLEAIRFKSDRSAPAQYAQAQKDAQTERDLLLPRIPKLRVLISGPVTDRTEILLDDKPLQTELIDTLLPVDPGKHQVRVRREDITVTKSASVPEASTARIEVVLPAIGQSVAAKAESTAATWRAWTIASFAVGGAGLLTFGISGSVALVLKADLDKRCVDRTCPPEAFGTLDSYDAAKTATTVGLVFGGVGIATGTTLLLVRPKPPPATDTANARTRPRSIVVDPYFGVASAGLRMAW